MKVGASLPPSQTSLPYLNTVKILDLLHKDKLLAAANSM